MYTVLLDLRTLFHTSPAQTSEGLCEEQELSNLMDSTPTPTSLEVREGNLLMTEEGFTLKPTMAVSFLFSLSDAVSDEVISPAIKVIKVMKVQGYQLIILEITTSC